MDFSFLCGLLVGYFFGVIGKPYLQQLIGTNSLEEQSKNKQFIWDELFSEHPQFMKRLLLDMNDPESDGITEFVVAEESAILNPTIARLRYNVSDEVISALNQLEQLNYIELIPNNCLLYRMSDYFIHELRARKTE